MSKAVTPYLFKTERRALNTLVWCMENDAKINVFVLIQHSLLNLFQKPCVWKRVMKRLSVGYTFTQNTCITIKPRFCLLQFTEWREQIGQECMHCDFCTAIAWKCVVSFRRLKDIEKGSIENPFSKHFASEVTNPVWVRLIKLTHESTSAF